MDPPGKRVANKPRTDAGAKTTTAIPVSNGAPARIPADTPVLNPVTADSVAGIRTTKARRMTRLDDFLLDRARYEIVKARFGRGDRRIRDTLLQIEDMVRKTETDGPLVIDGHAAAAHVRSRIDRAYRNMFSERDLLDPGDGAAFFVAMAHDFLDTLDHSVLESFDIDDGPTDVPAEPATSYDGQLDFVFCKCEMETRPKTFLGIIDLDDEIKGGGTFLYPATDSQGDDVGVPFASTYEHDFENDGDIDEELPDAPLVLARNVRILPGVTRFRAIFAIVEEDFLPTVVAQALAILFGKLLDILLQALIESAKNSVEAEIRRALERQGDLDPEQIDRAVQAFRDGLDSVELDKATGAIQDLVVRVLAELFGDDLFNPVEIVGDLVWEDTSKPPFYSLRARGGRGNGVVQAPQVARVSDVPARQATVLGDPGVYLLDFAFMAQSVQRA
jgi:hypothetical protein